MLIVPIVEGLNWRRPPPATLALILLNCLVFFFYQTGDAARVEKMAQAYFASSLPKVELPLYAEHLRATRPDLAARLARPGTEHYLFARMESDEQFMRDLHAGRVVLAEQPGYAQWKEDRVRIDALGAQISYRRFGFTPADPRPLTWLTSMFLHGDLMHLLGNMVFLFIVGVAVESALGGFWFVLLYLATGIAGDALHMLVHPASTMPSVGASGAISGLMGLFTVVFGWRKVNFFYWLLFVFGFRQLRGIVVLPVWIGWEILQFITDKEGHVGYMAHAGGLISGALLGLIVVRRLGAARVEEFHGKREQEAFDKAEYERARSLAAKLDFKAAGTVFARLAERFPGEGEMLRQWHAVAKVDPAGESYHRAVDAILLIPNPDATMRGFQAQVFKEYLGNARPVPRFDSRTLAKAGIAFAKNGRVSEAERAAEIVFKQAPAEPRLMALWEALAYALARDPADEGSLKKAKRYRALMSAHAKASATGAA
jgi:membrane associated rhomboid family serine protease